MSVARNLKQTATYWAPLGTDRYGKHTYASPQAIKCRWEDTNEQFINKMGETDVSRSRIMSLATMETDGYLLLGTSVATDPTVVAGALAIRSVRLQPDLRSLAQLCSAIL